MRIIKFLDALRFNRHNKTIYIKILVTSLLGQSFVIVMTYMLVLALGLNITVGYIFLVVPVSFLLTMFPVGVKGLLIAGLMAALLSSIDGMFTATGALFTEDIYLRFIRPDAKEGELKGVTRIVQGICVVITISVVPLVMKDTRSS